MGDAGDKNGAPCALVSATPDPYGALQVKVPTQIVEAFNATPTSESGGEGSSDGAVASGLTIQLGEGNRHVLRMGDTEWKLLQTTEKNCDCYRPNEDGDALQVIHQPVRGPTTASGPPTDPPNAHPPICTMLICGVAPSLPHGSV